MLILTCKHSYELNMRTDFVLQILYLLQTLWFKAINFPFIQLFKPEPRLPLLQPFNPDLHRNRF